MKNLLFGVLSRLSVENQARIFTNWLTSFFFVTDKTFPNRKMDVTNKNFAEKLPLIEASIDDAIFVAIDGEFTGLNCKETAISSLDTAAERYLKAQKSTTKFLLVQFGLCTFHYDPVKKVYSNRAFNFYVWPRPFSRAAPDPRFLCQASSIDFLSKQNFDFNKLFQDGISYLKSDDEKKLRDIQQEKSEMRRQSTNQFTSPSTPASGGNVPIPEDQKKFIDMITDKVDAWFQMETDAESVMYLERCNPFQRKLIYQTLRAKYGKEVFMETVDKDKDKVIAISKINAQEQERREAERDQTEVDELDTAVGFSRVIRKISASKKLVVGHNMLLDICFTLNQFVTNLPESYSDFKLLMQATLPLVCDTKLMASTTPFREEIRNSSLEELLRTVTSSPYKIPDMVPEKMSGLAGYSLGETNEKYHEAGYDAFITGLCFIALSNRLSQFRDNCPSNVMPDSPLVAPFLNKLHLMMSNDIPYMNLSGKDIEPNRDDVFHITFPAEWAHSDIQSLFFPFGAVFIYWLTDNTAYVRLKEPIENSRAAVSSTLKGSNLYHIMPYAQFKAMEATYGNTSGVTPTMERANVSFTTLKPSPHRHATARLPVNKISGPTSVAKQLQNQQSAEEELEPLNSSNLLNVPPGKKRSASPDINDRKRNKSVEDPAHKKAPTFEEPPWE